MSSQRSTVPRKLCTIVPMPTVIETAIVSEAIATAVRLSEDETPLAAMDAIMPVGLRDAGASPFSNKLVAGGTSSANPSSIPSSPPKLTTRLRVGMTRTPRPTRSRANPPIAE